MHIFKCITPCEKTTLKKLPYDGRPAALCYSSRISHKHFRAPIPCVLASSILFIVSRAIRWHKSLLSSFLCATCACDCPTLLIAAFAVRCRRLLVFQFTLILYGMEVLTSRLTRAPVAYDGPRIAYDGPGGPLIGD